jgi:ADP-heptose:LPS heptosyltransferase
VAGMDLVVCVDTSIAHLAAAMGKPVFMLHSLSGDVRWRKSGDSTAWYPSMRIFRQTRFMEWADVLDRVASEIATLAASRAQSGQTQKLGPVRFRSAVAV